MNAFQANPQRDAHAAIAGFFNQVNITLLRWLNPDGTGTKVTPFHFLSRRLPMKNSNTTDVENNSSV